MKIIQSTSKPRSALANSARPSPRQAQDDQFADSVLPFVEANSPLRPVNKGKDWTLPSPSSLPLLPTDSAGYGCTRSPLRAVGIPFFQNSTPSIPAGFLAPYYNPNDNNTVPVLCPPTDDCYMLKLAKSSFCLPQGIYEPMPCPSGFYCPDYKTVIVCPAGSYCLTGSVRPRKCIPLSYCPTGSVQQSHFGFLLFLILFDVILSFFIIYRRYREINDQGSISAKTLLPNFILKYVFPSYYSQLKRLQSTSSLSTPNLSLPDITPLVKAFKRGLMGQHDLTMNFSFKGMSMRLPTGKTILEGVTGEIRAGRMTAIMGPSGAGKTTFMNVLMGKVKRSGGDLLINGVPCEMEGLKKIIGFVPQEDIMLRELTVRENILHSARCRLPSDWTNKEVNEYVDNIIKVLNLTHVANSQIGDELTRGVSGGQRKRVNIGMELAAVPMSLFLDEPTSGLDATSALDVANVLKSLSGLGITIISIIHQPRIEIFEKFDDILMIAPGGRTAYLGPVENAKSYFESLGFYFEPTANRADIFMDIMAGRGAHSSSNFEPPMSVDDLVDEWSTRQSQLLTVFSESPKDDFNSSTMANSSLTKLANISEQRGANLLTQIWYCHTRSLTQQLRNSSSLAWEILVGILSGAIMGATALPDEMYSGLLISPFASLSPAPKHWFVSLYGLLIGMAIALSSAPAAVKVFGEERTVYFRESSSGHSNLGYFIGKVMGSLYRVLISSAHFTAFLFLIARLSMNLFDLFILLFLNFLVIYGMSHIISMIVSRKDAPLVAAFVGLFMGVFCGSGPSLTDARNSKIGIFILNLSGNRWFAEAFFGMWVDTYQGVYDFGSSADNYGYLQGQTNFNMWMMAALAVGYRIISFLLMISFRRRKE